MTAKYAKPRFWDNLIPPKGGLFGSQLAGWTPAMVQAAVRGRLAGLEILDAQKRFGGTEPMREVVLDGLESAATPLALHDKPAKYGKKLR